jgi:hypothetical protein
MKCRKDLISLGEQKFYDDMNDICKKYFKEHGGRKLTERISSYLVNYVDYQYGREHTINFIKSLLDQLQ